MNERWQPLLDRLTRRLDVDPELRLEVRRELETHLQDAAAELRRTERTDEQAADEAARALGEEDELAERLWQANRARLKWRGVVRWIARIGLVPAALVVALFVLPPNLAAVYRGWQLIDPVNFASDREDTTDVVALMALAAPLAPNMWLHPDPDAPRTEPIDLETLDRTAMVRVAEKNWRLEAQHWQQILARFEDHAHLPILYARYIVDRMSARDQPAYLSSRSPYDEFVPTIEPWWWEALQRGREIDPTNGLYPLLQAHALLSTSAELIRAETGDETKHLVIHNRQRFAEGLQYALQSASMPKLTAYATEWLQWQEQLRDADSFEDVMGSVERSISLLLPELGAVRKVVAYIDAWLTQPEALATDAGEASDVPAVLTPDLDHALRWADVAELLALNPTVDPSPTLITTLASYRGPKDVAELREKLYRQAGQDQAADQWAHNYAALEAKELHILEEPQPSWAPQTGFVAVEIDALRMVQPPPDLWRWRSIEWLTMDRIVAASGAMVLTLILLGYMVQALWNRARSRRDDDGTAAMQAAPRSGIALWIGWRRLARIALLSIVLPIGIYAVYAWSPLGGRGYGLNVAAERAFAEYVFVIATCITLLRELGRRAVRDRMRELGLELPQPMRDRRRGWLIVVSAVVAVAFVIYEIAWRVAAAKMPVGEWALGSPIGVDGWGYVVAGGAIVTAGLWWLADQAAWRRVRRESRAAEERSGRHLPFALRATVVVAVVGLILAAFAWRQAPAIFMREWFAAVLATGAALVAWIAFEGLSAASRSGWHAATLARSMQPVLALPVVILGIALAIVSGAAEAAVARGTQPFVITEVERSVFAELRDDMIERRTELLQSFVLDDLTAAADGAADERR